ncbi:GM16245 [Drosophila sechellia]|uniref:GM16245 n=2 Tax=melanogaster subgroup TaxID=32351 RepID=B4INY6_DROSE|nr:GM16245 [Drosophila sechellia]
MATVSATQALAVKRVAPFLLIFTIRQMVATERPTTLFEKIKVHIVRVCHELIGICDHRAGHFILRSSNEAGARMYEGLVKDHEKYHKFRGKV